MDRADRQLTICYDSMRRAELREAMHERLLKEVAQAMDRALGIIRKPCALLPQHDENYSGEELPPLCSCSTAFLGPAS